MNWGDEGPTFHLRGGDPSLSVLVGCGAGLGTKTSFFFFIVFSPLAFLNHLGISCEHVKLLDSITLETRISVK
jgi:hypothetical protein